MSTSIQVPFYSNRATIGEIYVVTKVMESWKLSSNEYVEPLEKEFAKYIGAKHAIAVNSCTSGVHLLLDILKPTFASIPSMTFVSIANTIKNLGIELQLRDELSPGVAYQIITDKGVIMDSAHEVYAGQFSEFYEIPIDDDKELLAAVYSFYPTKNIASCEGGMIATDDDDLASELRLMRSHGMVRNGYDWNYNVQKIGWKMNMNSLQAVLALEQLKLVEENNQKRLDICMLYDKAFGQNWATESNHIYKVKVDHRDNFILAMKDKGIECSMHFKPIHTQPAYSEYRDLPFPKTMKSFETMVSIPLWPQMTNKQVNYVIHQINDYLN